MVTDRIIKEMEKGIIPWQKPWHSTGNRLVSHTTGKPYSWLNQLLLGFKAGEYITFNQCKAEGGSVKAGEKASFVVFWTFPEKTIKEIDEDGKEVTRRIQSQHPILKYYNVFHIDQCQGIKAKHPETLAQVNQHHDPIKEAENIVDIYFARETCTLDIDNNDGACYSPTFDRVSVPQMGQYENVAEYYSTLFHEMTHSTGHKSRLDRLSKTARFGSQEYSREELVAEIGAAYLMQHAGIENGEAFKNSVGYLQGWMKALKNDPKMIVVAAGKAEAAAEFILTGKKPNFKNNKK